MPFLLDATSALGPYIGMVAALVLGSVGLPLPEDLILLGAGFLAHRGGASLVPIAMVAAVGVWASDLLVFVLARRLGPLAVARAPFRWFLTPTRRARIERLFERHQRVVLVVARFLPGLRSTTFVMAAWHGVPLRRFLLIDALAVAVCAPLVVTLGYLASTGVDRMASNLALARLILLAAVVAGLAVLAALWSLRWRRPPV